MRKIITKILLLSTLFSLLFLLGAFLNPSIINAAETTNSTASTSLQASSLSEAFSSIAFSTKDVFSGLKNIGKFSARFATLYITGALISPIVVLSASILKGMLWITIEKFPDIYQSSGIDSVWSIVRNIINITFIFILLYASITMILGLSSANTKKIISSVVVSAVLINFSLFITKIIIDAGNLVAINLYNITGTPLSSFSELFVNGLKIQSLWKLDAFLSNITRSGQESTILVLMAQIVFMVILIWAYLKAAFLLLGRMVLLLFLMATSPIGFAGDVVPGLKDKAAEWWSAFLNQVMVAPVFILFLTIIAKIIEADSLNKINSIANSIPNTNFKIGPILLYIILIAMLVTAVKVTTKLAGAVGSFAEKMAKALIAGIAIAVTGGVAIAAGSTAAAAAATGVSRSAAAGRIARGLFTGEISNETGAAGIAGRFARSKFMDTAKDVSYGKVDLGKLEKNIKKGLKDEGERIKKQADAIGPSAAEKRLEQINKIEAGFNDQVDRKLNDETSPEFAITKEFKEAAKKQEDALKKETEVEKKLVTANERLSIANPQDRNQLAKEVQVAEEELKLAQQKSAAAKTEAEEKTKLFNKRKEAIEKEVETSTGLNKADFEKQRNEAGEKIKKGIVAKAEYAKNLTNRGFIASGGLTKSDLKKLADEVRAQKGPYKNEEDDFRKLIKKYAAEEKKEEAPKTETKTT